jgi:hypothetical protein
MLARPDRRKWTRWIDRISNELSRSAVDREVFEQWWAVVQGNPALDINNRFMALVWSSYFDRQVLVVRRQLQAKDSVSLVRLLKEVAAHAGSLKLSTDRVEADIKRLTRRSSGLKYLSDKWLAHSDPRRRWPRLGFKQLNKSLDTLYSLWHKYHEVVRGGPINADPHFLAGSDWQHVFDIPWRSIAQGGAG